MTYENIIELLGTTDEELLSYTCTKISKENLQLPGPDFTERVWLPSGRNNQTICSLNSIFNAGRLAGTDYSAEW